MRYKQFTSTLSVFCVVLSITTVFVMDFEVSISLLEFNCITDGLKSHFEPLTIILCYLFGRVICGSTPFLNEKVVNLIARIFAMPNIVKVIILQK